MPEWVSFPVFGISDGHNYINDLINRNRLVEADRELEKLISIAPGYFVRLHAERMSLAAGNGWQKVILGG